MSSLSWTRLATLKKSPLFLFTPSLCEVALFQHSMKKIAPTGQVQVYLHYLCGSSMLTSKMKKNGSSKPWIWHCGRQVKRNKEINWGNTAEVPFMSRVDEKFRNAPKLIFCSVIQENSILSKIVVLRKKRFICSALIIRQLDEIYVHL